MPPTLSASKKVSMKTGTKISVISPKGNEKNMNITKLALVTASSLALASLALVIGITQKPPRELSRNSTISARTLKRTADEDKLHHAAYTAWRQKNLPEAERLFRKALAVSTSDADAWIALARIMDEQGRYREALAFYDGFLGPHPAWGSSEQLEFHVLTRYADLCDMFGRPDDATKACLTVLQTNPDPTKNYLDDSNMFVRVDTDDPTEIRARAHILTAMWLQQFSDGFANGRVKNTALALRAYREAVRLKPDLPIAHYYLAQGLKHFGHIAEAQTEMASAARLGDDTFQAAMTAKVRNKEEERKYDMAHPRKGVAIATKHSDAEWGRIITKQMAESKRLKEEALARGVKVGWKAKPQPQPQP